MAKASPFRFATKYQDDETDLLYYGYRFYNASTGRWLSGDPIGEKGGRNLFGFCGNSPVTASDRLGLFLEVDPGIRVPPQNCRYVLKYDFIPEKEFTTFWERMNQIGITYVSSSKDIIKDISSKIRRHDPDGNCCRGSCIRHLAISAHSQGAGEIPLSSGDRPAEYFNLQEELTTYNQLNRGIPIPDETIDRLSNALSFLNYVAGKMCRNGRVSIVVCGAEYFGGPYSLKRRLQEIFGPTVEVETFVQFCTYRLGIPAEGGYNR
jgi:RHS repeat-associated protein